MATTRAAADWLATAQAQLLRGEVGAAQVTLAQALAEHPASVELRRMYAGLEERLGRMDETERVLRELLAENPGDAASAFTLARLLKDAWRVAAAGAVMRDCFAVACNAADVALAINAIELLDDCDRKFAAMTIADAAIAANPSDPRLHAYAGMLDIQLGRFEDARGHYQFALEHDERAWEWHVPLGLSSAQRYADVGHPDFALFRSGLRRHGLSELARAELHFALGKAHDDIGEYAHATQHFREGNALRKRLAPWSRKSWRRMLDARLAARRSVAVAAPLDGFTPVFIVGMPRSGTTLLAELLSRHPGVCNRGELPTLARLAQDPALAATPGQPALQRAAAHYARAARRDDAEETRWFIDKQPLNFRYVDLALAMFPDARIIHCVRNPRDTALSLWQQCFLEDVQGYAYDFDDIATVLRDSERLLAHWRKLYPDSMRTQHYENMVAAPQETVSLMTEWIGLPAAPPPNSRAVPPPAINTASLWQARQPVYSHSVERWRHYAPLVPELSKIPERQ